MVDMQKHSKQSEIQLPTADEQIAALARVDDRHIQITEALDWLKQGKSGGDLEAIEFVEHQMQQYRADLENAYVLIGATKDVAEKFQEQRNEATTMLEKLEAAIDAIDESHPKVAGLIEMISEWEGEAALEYAFMLGDEQLGEFFHEITGLSYAECSEAASQLSSAEPDLTPVTIKVLEVLLEKAKQGGEE